MSSYIANLGDTDFIAHGGRLVFEAGQDDEWETLDVIEPPEDEEEEKFAKGVWTVYQIPLERYQLVHDEENGDAYLVPLGWEESWGSPSLYDEWFNKYLPGVAASADWDLGKLRAGFTDANPVKRASSYCALGDIEGFYHLDSDAQKLTLHEACEQYDEECECEACTE